MSGPIDPLRAGFPEGAVGLFTTRLGGYSKAPWAELNLARHVEDDAHHVLANRELLARHLGVAAVNLPQQIHGAGVLVLDAARAGTEQLVHGGAADVDALVTSEPGVAIGVLVADCLPVLICDVGAGVAAVAHVGRRGLAAGVLQNTVAAMVRCGARVEQCLVVIGPGVCGRCYEVPEQMREEVAAIVPGTATTTAAGAPALDLPAGAEHVLHSLGVEDVQRTAICTVEDPRFYSYRRDGRTGRFAGVVILAPRD